MKVLDVCCGSKMMWFNRQRSDVLFGDIRAEDHVLCDGRRLEVTPSTLLDFRSLPFREGEFKLVVFDPPHLTKVGAKSWLFKKYGKLGARWEEDLKQGFSECFRVLKEDGVLIFKWNETQVKTSKVLSLSPIAPLFGHVSGKRSNTHWLCFIKQVNTHD